MQDCFYKLDVIPVTWPTVSKNCSQLAYWKINWKLSVNNSKKISTMICPPVSALEALRDALYKYSTTTTVPYQPRKHYLYGETEGCTETWFLTLFRDSWSTTISLRSEATWLADELPAVARQQVVQWHAAFPLSLYVCVGVWRRHWRTQAFAVFNTALHKWP